MWQAPPTFYLLHVVNLVSLVIFSNHCRSLAFPAFYIRIPNGDKVPHVCPPSSSNPKDHIWPAVGHWRSKGGDGSKYSLNPFGRDFGHHGFQWNTDLCRSDSDEDGKTNGEELGDPNCEWTQKSHEPPVANATSHPGICEPIDSMECAKFNAPLAFECPNDIEMTVLDDGPDNEQLVCPPIGHPAVRKVELLLNGGKADVAYTDFEKHVVHFCQKFELPNDHPYHIIAIKPTTNRDGHFFITHFTLHACTDYSDNFNLAALGGLKEPNKNTCQLLKPCRKLVGSWRFDANSKAPIYCISSLAGIRFGSERFSKVVADFYYAFRWEHLSNNSSPFINVLNSGVTIYYTSKLRRYDMGTLLVGENFIKVPPHYDQYNVTADIKDQCLGSLVRQNTITPVYASIHVNRLATKASLMLYAHSHADNEQALSVFDKIDEGLEQVGFILIVV